MKRISVLFVAVGVAIMSFVTSCTKDDTSTAPVITFSNGITETTLPTGTTSWEINATITSDAGLDKVVLSQVYSDGEDQIGDAITSFDDKNSFDLKKVISGVTVETTIKVTATDKNDVTTTRNFVIKVTAVVIPTADKLVFYTGTLASQLGATNSTIGSSYASSTNAVYLSSGAKANSSLIDLVYFYSTSADVAAELISPKYAADNGNVLSASSWTVKNATLIAKANVTATEFDNIVTTNDALVVSSVTGIATQRANSLAVGDVIAFTTAAGKSGLAKVKALTTGASGSITIEVKVQK